ncbi:MAG: methyltransferase domain-containing protein [Oscillospiraceae bacterium]|nr:methyltransferase domain-containing protein [Oscillospiraceae bacterium]
MNEKYSLYNLHARVKYLQSLLDLDKITDGEKNSTEEIVSYFKINEWAYRRFHSQDGFMHFRISKNGAFADEDVYYQPDTVAKHIHDGDRVVELGCGRGSNIIYLAKSFPKTRFCGFDLSAVKKPLPPNVRTFQQDYSSMKQIPDQSVDLVYAFETIVHNTDKKKTMAEVYRILKPGGVFIVYDYALTAPFETYAPLEQTALALISKGGCCPLIESVSEWESYFESCGFKAMHTAYLGKECLPDLKRLERLAGRILDHPGRVKLMFRLFPDLFTSNIIIGYLGYDACNAGLGTYAEWIYQK